MIADISYLLCLLCIICMQGTIADNVIRWREDGRCGKGFLGPHGELAECNPDDNPCCSQFGWCGQGSQFCTCRSCVDYGLEEEKEEEPAAPSAPAAHRNPPPPHPQDNTHQENQDLHHQTTSCNEGNLDMGTCGDNQINQEPEEVVVFSTSESEDANDMISDGASGISVIRDSSDLADTDIDGAAAVDDDYLNSDDHHAVVVVVEGENTNENENTDTHVANFKGHQQVLRDFEASKIWERLRVETVMTFVNSGKPFAIFMLCQCENDNVAWDIPAIDKLLVERNMQDKFAYLYALPSERHRFRMDQTYDCPNQNAVQLVLDDIPIGQHVSKFKFPYELGAATPTWAEGSTRVTPTSHDFVDFFQDFFLDPCPLQRLIRSAPLPPRRDWSDRGMIWEIVGDNAQEIVLDSPYDVFLMVYNPTCPSCVRSMPELEAFAARLMMNPSVIVARIDMTKNDFPVALPFKGYPSFFLFRAGHKHYAPLDFLTLRQEGASNAPDTCSNIYSEEEFMDFLTKYSNINTGIAWYQQPASSSSSPNPDAQVPDQPAIITARVLGKSPNQKASSSSSSSSSPSSTAM